MYKVGKRNIFRRSSNHNREYRSTSLCTYSEGQLLSSEHPDARDGAVIVGAKQDDAGKGILSQFVQALEHSYEDHTAFRH